MESSCFTFARLGVHGKWQRRLHRFVPDPLEWPLRLHTCTVWLLWSLYWNFWTSGGWVRPVEVCNIYLGNNCWKYCFMMWDKARSPQWKGNGPKGKERRRNWNHLIGKAVMRHITLTDNTPISDTSHKKSLYLPILSGFKVRLYFSAARFVGFSITKHVHRVLLFHFCDPGDNIKSEKNMGVDFWQVFVLAHDLRALNETLYGGSFTFSEF